MHFSVGRRRRDFWLGRTILFVLTVFTISNPLVSQQRCSRQQRDADLAGMQRWILRYYNKTHPHQQLSRPGNVLLIFFVPHFFRSNQGVGVTFTPGDGLAVLEEEDRLLAIDELLHDDLQNRSAAAGALYDALRSGLSLRRTNIAPQLVMYAPALGSDFTDGRPDPPYTLIGWGYVASPGRGSPPWIMCGISPSDYFFHEAGWHLSNGGMALTPQDPDSWSDGVPGGVFYHQLSWSVHIWINEYGLPRVQPCPPYRIPGVALPAGAFLWPDGRRIQC